MALLEINGKRYERVEANAATLADFIALKRQTGLGLAQLQELVGQFEGLEPDEVAALVDEHPELLDDVMLATGISVWLTRRHAGENLTLEEACAIKLDDLREVPEPGDHKPAASTKGKGKASADPR